jgi:hypothetical protein
MSTALVFMTNWRKWQRVLRSRKGFGLIDSVRFGLWLARGSAAPARKVQPRGEIYRTAHAA